MVRFFATPPDISNDKIQLSAEDMAHMRSLRLRPTEYFVVCDGKGTDYICTLSEIEATGRGVLAEIVDKKPSLGEPSVKCSVYIAFAKGDRLDYAVQKLVELGAYEIFLFPSERCISTPNDKMKKAVRYQRIALETAKQCGRGIIPEVNALEAFDAAVKMAIHAKTPLFLYECEDKRHLHDVLSKSQRYSSGTHLDSQEALSVSIMTGPEGGFEPQEANCAISAGMQAITLGPRILRCETAPVAALAAIMYHTGNL